MFAKDLIARNILSVTTSSLMHLHQNLITLLRNLNESLQWMILWQTLAADTAQMFKGPTQRAQKSKIIFIDDYYVHKSNEIKIM